MEGDWFVWDSDHPLGVLHPLIVRPQTPPLTDSRHQELKLQLCNSPADAASGPVTEGKICESFPSPLVSLGLGGSVPDPSLGQDGAWLVEYRLISPHDVERDQKDRPCWDLVLTQTEALGGQPGEEWSHWVKSHNLLDEASQVRESLDGVGGDHALTFHLDFLPDGGLDITVGAEAVEGPGSGVGRRVDRGQQQVHCDYYY